MLQNLSSGCDRVAQTEGSRLSDQNTAHVSCEPASWTDVSLNTTKELPVFERVHSSQKDIAASCGLDARSQSFLTLRQPAELSQ